MMTMKLYVKNVGHDENENDEDVTDLADEQPSGVTPLNIFDPRNWDSRDKKNW